MDGPDSGDGVSDSDDSGSDQQSYPDGPGGNRPDEKFEGPNGALRAVQANRALPLDDIVTIARHLTNGQTIDARLRPVRGVLQYELKVLETNSESEINMRILVAEDDRRIAESLGTALSAAGFLAEYARDGEDAWFR
eukprot:gene28734-34970_t